MFEIYYLELFFGCEYANERNHRENEIYKCILEKESYLIYIKVKNILQMS